MGTDTSLLADMTAIIELRNNILHVVEQVNDQYGEIHDSECRDLMRRCWTMSLSWVLGYRNASTSGFLQRGSIHSYGDLLMEAERFPGAMQQKAISCDVAIGACGRGLRMAAGSEPLGWDDGEHSAAEHHQLQRH